MSDDSSPLVRAEVSSSPNHSHLITDEWAKEVMCVSDDSDSEKFSRGFPNKGAYSSDSSFNAFFSYEDGEDDQSLFSCLLKSCRNFDFAFFLLIK